MNSSSRITAAVAGMALFIIAGCGDMEQPAAQPDVSLTVTTTTASTSPTSTPETSPVQPSSMPATTTVQAPTTDDSVTTVATAPIELTVPTFPPATLPGRVPGGEHGNGTKAATPAVDVLAGLVVSPERRGGYDRDLFEHWTDIDANGCGTRDDVLRDESLQPAQIDPYGCKVLAGLWRSAYDNITTEDPTDLDIDHVVALAEAWDSGAWQWDSATRERYANDRDDPRSLIAVTSSSNRSKSAYDHTEWLPQHERCTYTADVLAVKSRWKLSIDSAEHAAISALLAGECVGLVIEQWPPASIGTEQNPAVTTPSSTVAVPPVGDTAVDPRFETCAAAKAAGYGPYRSGVDIEYGWYRDGDSDGTVCE